MMGKWFMCGGLTVSERLLSAAKWAGEEKPRSKLQIIIIIILVELFVCCYHRHHRCHYHYFK